MDNRADLTFYRWMHRALRTDATRLVEALADLEPAPTAQAAALAWWTARYREVLHHHHETEDDIVFPVLAARVPGFDALAADMEADHQVLSDVLDRLPVVVARMAHVPDGDGQAARDEAYDLAVQLHHHLLPHLDREDTEILPMIERTINAAEYEQIEKDIGRRYPLRAAWFTGPWIESSLSAEERATFHASLPAPLRLVVALGRRGFRRRVARAFPPAGAAQPVALEVRRAA